MKTALKMDLVLRILVCVIVSFVCSSTHSSVAADPTPSADLYEIRLKSRQFTPNPAIARTVRAEKVGRPWHGLIQFDQPVSETGLQALRAKGIKIRHYISGHTVSASVPGNVDPSSLPGVRWSGDLTAEDKLLGAPERDVLVEFFPDAPEREVSRLIDASGGDRLPTPSLPSFVVRVVLPAGDPATKTLAGSELVSSVAATPQALRDGGTFHYCPGPMTLAGPVAHYVLRGEGWDGPGRNSVSLTYYFGSSTSDLNSAAQREEIVRALNTWSRYAAISWSQTSTPRRNRSFDIHFASGSHGDDSPFDGPGSVLAHCFYPSPPNSEPIAGDMHFDDDETWRIGARFDLFSVALHEAGHGLGLNHSDRSDAVMAPYYSGVVRDLAPDDIAGIRALYASSSMPPQPSVPNDAFGNPVDLVGLSGRVTGSNRAATREVGEPAHAGIAASKSIWYRWVAPFSGNYSFRTLTSTFDTVLAVYTGQGISGLTSIAANDDANGGVSSEVRFTAVGGTQYRIAIDGYGGASGDVILTWEGMTRPTITVQPGSRSVIAGQPVVFSVTASGSGSLTYQWFKNGSQLTGANQASYAIGAALQTDAGAYQVRVSNANGFVVSDTAVLEVTLSDRVPPRIRLVSPAPRSRHYSSQILVSGRAFDDQRVARVEYRINGGPWQIAQGTDAWYASVRAIPGPNMAEFRAIDGSGNASTSAQLQFTYVATSQLSLRIHGSGRVTPNLDGQFLEVGRRYTIKANPENGSIFSHWSGPAATEEASLNFVMTEGMVLGANFVSNPFADVSGRYDGLFLDTNGVDQASSGYFTCKVTSKGKFTASVRWMGTRIPVSGLFRANGRTTNFIAIGNLPPLRTELALDFQNKDRITGTIYVGTRRAQLHADRKGTTRGRFAGRYRVALPNHRIETNQPAVLGHLGIRIDDDGNAVVGGKMVDGGEFTHTTMVSRDGYLPLHAPLGRGKSSIIGWLYITPADSVAVRGLVSWLSEPALGGPNAEALSDEWHRQSMASGERTDDSELPTDFRR